MHSPLRSVVRPLHHGTDPDLTADTVVSGVTLDIAGHEGSSSSLAPPSASPMNVERSAGMGVGMGMGMGRMGRGPAAQQRLQQRFLGGEHRAKAPALGEIDDMMEKAKRAAHHIYILDHAKACNGGCDMASCAGAKRLLEHIKTCTEPPMGCNPNCSQAKRLMRHRATCQQQAAISRPCGSTTAPICLVCSLVARASVHPHPLPASAADVKPSAGLAHRPRGASNEDSRRAMPKRKACESGKAVSSLAATAPVLPSSQSAPGPLSSLPTAVAAPPASAGVQSEGARDSDGFLLPAPVHRVRSVSWGGYDRRTPQRRPRFDSIPEDPQAEESEGGTEE